MAQTTAIKRRINSVKNTKQITKAMELVAASKMRRAQEAALKSRDFHNLANQILTRLRELTDVSKHPLYNERPIKTRLHLLISSDRGLAGAYNGNLFRQFATEVMQDKKDGVASKIIVIGKQGSRLVARLKGLEVIAAYHNFPERPTANDIRPILNTVIDKFVSKEIDVVDIIYTHYNSSINQVVQVQRLLPAAFQEVKLTPDLESATFEPSPKEVLDNVTERLIEAELNQTFLESLASEHSMRMLAMKNATDNATDLIDDLTLVFNTARQAAITQELAEITGGAEAIAS
jgi:F-type H+-transporting ATPase subunit gamma